MTSVETIHLSSSSATQKVHDGDFTVLLGATLHNIEAVELASCALPNTFLTIRDTEKLAVAITGSSTPTISLTPGSYTSTSVLTMLKSVLDAGDSAGTYTCTFDSSTFKLKITRDSGTFQLLPNTARVSRVLGFPLTPAAAAASQTGTEVAQLGLNTVLIASRSLRNPVLGENAATFLIVQKEGSGGVTVYTSNEYRQLHRYRTPIRTLDRVDIKLMSAYADEGTLSTQGFPVDLVLRITHTPI